MASSNFSYKDVKADSDEPILYPSPVALTPTTVAPTSNYSSRKGTTLKSRVTAGDTLYGLVIMSASPTLAEIAGLAGCDFVVIDMEHGPGGISNALACVRALAAAATPALIRVPEKSATWAKKALDLGPQGIIFPMVDSAKIAEQVVSYCRYQPRGVRGTAHALVRASGYGTDEGYVDRCEDDLLIFCMVETEAGVEVIEAIAAVDGVDCIQIGPNDLGASMGYLKDPSNPKVKELLEGVERRVLATQKSGRGAFLGGIVTLHHKVDDLRARGYNFLAGGVDTGVFRQAAVEDVQRFRRGGASPAVALTPTTVALTSNHSSRKGTSLKSRVAAGDTVYGLCIMSASPTIAEIAGLAGYDFVVIDMQHSPCGISDALACVRALAAAATPAVIRVPEKSATWAKKALDLGPQGIIFPMVESAKNAEQVVSYCRYPPRGVRGTAHILVRASGYGTDEGYVDRCEDDLLIFCMVETEAGVEAIEAIAAVDDVDCIQMSPCDLGASMGYLKDTGNPKVKDVLEGAERRVLATQKSGRGAFLGGVVSPPHHNVHEMRARGYNFVAGGMDIGVFQQAVVENVQRFRRGAAPPAVTGGPARNGVHVPSAAQ